MNEPLRIAVVGCGYHGTVQAGSRWPSISRTC